jgi:hypothetical protein
VYKRILDPVCDNEKENWRILTNKEMYAVDKKLTIRETLRLDYVGLGMDREYYIWVWKQQSWEVDQEIDGKKMWGRMKE